MRTDSVPRPPGSGRTDLSHIRFAVVGAGRLGISLALALRRCGATLTGFVCATAAGRDRAEELLRMPPALGLDDLISTRPTHYLMTVPDAALPAVAQELGTQLPDVSTHTHATAPAVLHTSGATSVSVLSACEQKGALTLVFHPLQTFSEPVSGSARFDGAAVAVTPSAGSMAAAALDAGFELSQGLGARPFLLADDKRALYHAAATVASNYLVTLEHCAELLFIRAGMPPEEALSLFLPLVQAALDNVGRQGSVAALTGPLSRADETTIAVHLTALEREAPALLPLYRHLGLLTLELVRARGEVGPDALDRLTHLLNE